MSIFSFHIAKVSLGTAIKALWNSSELKPLQGLIHSECMTAMTLGAPLFSSSRILIGQVAYFAQWENEQAIDTFLRQNSFGKKLSAGWHTRLEFLRQWGTIDGFEIPKSLDIIDDHSGTVVAVTLARMKILQVPRFIQWGRPVEKLVRDHPGVALAMAAIRFPRTVSTFSIWKNQTEMLNMVHGHSNMPKPKRHAMAMKERERKDFHFQFTTLRFKPIAEYGIWEGRTNIIPDLNIK